MAAPAASQTQTQAASNQDLTAHVAAGAEYDANVFGSNLTAVADDTLPRKGTYVSNDVSLDYSRAGSLDIGATASSGLRLYETDRNYSAQTFSGAALVSGTIASRLHIAVSVEAVRSSQYLFWIFPVTSYGGTVFGLPMPSLNDRITPIFITTYGSDIAASYTLSRRSSLSAEYGVRRSIIRAISSLTYPGRRSALSKRLRRCTSRPRCWRWYGACSRCRSRGASGACAPARRRR